MAVQQMPTSFLLPGTRRGGTLAPVNRGGNRVALPSPDAAKLPTNRRQLTKGARTRAAFAVRTLRDPMTIAVLVAVFFVSLLSFYVAAYARVTADSFALSELKKEVEAARRVGDNLRAQVSLLSLPGAVHQGALRLGMRQAAPETLQIIATPSVVNAAFEQSEEPIAVAGPAAADRKNERSATGTRFVVAATGSAYVQ